MNKRIDYIDTAKGIGILLVVFGHAFTIEDSLLKVYVYSFHLPLFFFISGLFYKPEKYNNYIVFLRNKVRTLVIPYITFSLISLFVFIIIQNVSSPDKITFTVYHQIKNIIYGDGQHLAQLSNVALWFLPCLFIVENLFYWVVKCSKNKSFSIGSILVLLSIFGFIYREMQFQSLPWSIHVAIIAIGFYGIGYITSLRKEILEKYFVNINGFYTTVIFLVSLVFSMINGRIDMNGNNYGYSVIFFYISAFAGIITIMKLSTKLNKIFLINYFGRNSIVIFGLHFLMFQLVATYQLQRIIFNNFFMVKEDPFTMVILYTILGTLMTMPFVYIFNRYFSYLIGKKAISK